MNNAIKAKSTEDGGILTIKLAGETLKYTPQNDSRVEEVIDGKVFTTSLEGAETLAAELNLFGVTEARALGFAVVFWS